MSTLLILLLGTMLIQGSAIAVSQPATPHRARGVFADEFRTASFTVITLTLASLYGFVVTHSVLQPLTLAWLQMPVMLGGIALIFVGTRAALGHLPGAVRWPNLLVHLTHQCAMLGLALFSSLSLETAGETLLYGLGAALALAVLSACFFALRERIDAADVPMIFRGIPIALITAGFMALALMGFAGMVRN